MSRNLSDIQDIYSTSLRFVLSLSVRLFQSVKFYGLAVHLFFATSHNF
jgi:hypothetical protein